MPDEDELDVGVSTPVDEGVPEKIVKKKEKKSSSVSLKSENPAFRYLARWTLSKNLRAKECLIYSECLNTYLNNECDDYIFQVDVETGGEGETKWSRMYYLIYFRLKQKKRLEQVIHEMQEYFENENIHVERFKGTSTDVKNYYRKAKDVKNYYRKAKEETWLSGPWSKDKQFEVEV